MASTAVSPSDAPENANSLGRVFGAIFSPKPTFQSIVRRPTWILPTLLLCVLFAAVVGIFGARGGWPSFFEKQVANNSRFQEMPADQQQRVLEAQVKWGPRVAYAEVVVPIILVVVVAAIYLGLFNGLMGVKFNFKTSLGIAAHAWMPGVISGILGVIIVSIKDPSTIDLQNIIASNAAIFLSSEAPRWKITLLSSLDIFSFWTMILLAIGYGSINPRKLSTGKALFGILLVWALWVLVRTGATAAFS